MNIDDLTQKFWEAFGMEHALTEQQVHKFQTYASLLVLWNAKFNLTALVELVDIVQYHFADSLRLGKQFDLSGSKTLCDIGTGGGFPGIPLKIKYPECKLILMEVSEKKRQFLGEVVRALQLTNVIICELDFRTFLRTMDEQIDYFLARASLGVEELCRLFSAASRYKDSTLIYWASAGWEPNQRCKQFVRTVIPYVVGTKTRKLVVLGR